MVIARYLSRSMPRDCSGEEDPKWCVFRFSNMHEISEYTFSNILRYEFSRVELKIPTFLSE